MSAVIRVVREPIGRKDAYDRHKAIVKIDGRSIGQVAAGGEGSYNVEPGELESVAPAQIQLRYGEGALRRGGGADGLRDRRDG